ncbi:27528_t:CDS:2, partial [Dentiscutata erythropus]
MPPPRRKYLGVAQTSTFDSHKKVVDHVKEIHKTTLLGLIYRQDSRRAEDLLFKRDSYKVKPYRKLDRLINELTHAEEKYLPLTEHEYSVKQVFAQSRQSILQLQENFKMFTQHQLSLNQTIMNKKVLAEKEKVATTIENLCKEVANLKSELIKNNKQIESLNERHKKLLNSYGSLLNNHTVLKEDYVALSENNSDYYAERCYLLVQENSELVKRNLELFEEIEWLHKEIRTLYDEIEKLKKRNESLSCLLIPMWIIGYDSQIYVLHPLLELNIRTLREELGRAFQSSYSEESTFLLFGVIAVKKGSIAILCEIEVYTGSPEL